MYSDSNMMSKIYYLKCGTRECQILIWFYDFELASARFKIKFHVSCGYDVRLKINKPLPNGV